MEMFGQVNSLIQGDNLNYLKGCLDNGKTNFIDLIYIDPPFNSNRDYNLPFNNNSKESEDAFKDIWSSYTYNEQLEELKNKNIDLFLFLESLEKTNIPKSYICYLTMMGIRCWYMREVLKNTGTFYYHCDPTMSHYIKIILDFIFGINNFRNEIIWSYKTGGIPLRNFAKKHDVILFYSKSNNYTFNPQESKKNTESLNSAIKRGKIFEDDKGLFAWRNEPSDKYPNGNKEYLEYANMRDVWEDIHTVKATAKERKYPYPTQKPLDLLKRVILSGSNPEDLVVDFFTGGGTTLIAAIKEGRKFIGIDLNSRAIQITKTKIEELKLISKKDFYIYGIPKSSKELRDLVNQNLIGKSSSTMEFEEVITRYYLKGVTGNKKKVNDNSVDGRFTFNYQNKIRKGIVQVTTSQNKNHFKAFCSEVSNGNADMGVYITFSDLITTYMKRVENGLEGNYGKLGNIPRIQILSVEDLIDNGKQFKIPSDILTI